MDQSLSFAELYNQNDRPIFSFEFFPPKKSTDLPQTKDLIRHLNELSPDFMTVTYGAGGSTRQRTAELVSFIVNNLRTSAAAHLTCVDHSVQELSEILDSLASSGIRHVLALRGDPPQNSEEFKPHPQGLSCARDLASFIKQRGDFSIAVAGYPETHPSAESAEADIDYLKQKVAAGAEIVITQLFFDHKLYFSFLSRVRQAGIKVPIVPGIMPISNVRQIERFTSMCGASVPGAVIQELRSLENHPDKVLDFGTEYALNLCRELLNGGAPGIHFYTLNKSDQTEKILLQLKADSQNKSNTQILN
jgi:methylenetetrahydrofolate reductase (NADPH)